MALMTTLRFKVSASLPPLASLPRPPARLETTAPPAAPPLKSMSPHGSAIRNGILSPSFSATAPTPRSSASIGNDPPALIEPVGGKDRTKRLKKIHFHLRLRMRWKNQKL